MHYSKIKTLLLSLMLGTAIIAAVLTNVTATTTVPTGYTTTGVNLTQSWIYNITGSNGWVQYYYPDYFTNAYVATPVGGTIAVQFVGFYDYNDLFSGDLGTMPYFNVTFNLANGAVNKTLVNQSIYSLAYSLDLGFGSFDPAFYSPVNWSQNDAAALAAANSASYTNGTVTISNSSNLHTYLYKQNPEDGSQNTTLSFDINTGVLQSFSAGYGNYTLTASLYVPTTSTIPGFSIGLIFLSAVATVGIILRRKH